LGQARAGDGLRRRQSGRELERRRRAHLPRHGARHAGLHGPRAGRGRPHCRSPRRPVCRRGARLRAARRPDAVRRAVAPGHARGPGDGHPGPRHPAPRQRTARARGPDHALPRQAPGRSPPERGRAARPARSDGHADGRHAARADDGLVRYGGRPAAVAPRARRRVVRSRRRRRAGPRAPAGTAARPAGLGVRGRGGTRGRGPPRRAVDGRDRAAPGAGAHQRSVGGRRGRAPLVHVAPDVALARELAGRGGAKAVVHGQIAAVGRGYVLSAELVSAPDGATLVALREDAKDDGAIIAAVDRLSARLRERIGESLRAIRASEPLEQVTTGSLEALRKYSQALKANDAGQFARAVSLLEEAISLDSTFAIAYRKLAEAARTVESFAGKAPQNPLAFYLRAGLAGARRDFDSAEAIVRAEAQLVPDPALQEQTAYVLAHLSLVRGRLADAERHAQTALDLSEQRGLPGSSVGYAVMLSMIELHYRNAPDAARRLVEEALRRHPLASI